MLSAGLQFDSRPVVLVFVVEEVALEQVFSECFGFPFYHSTNAPDTCTQKWHRCYLILRIDSVLI
jgi:hypothetical protein